MKQAHGRLLIVDDEIELMSALRDALGTQGYDVVGLSNGHHALALLAQENFDLLLSDLMMPEMDGITLLQSALQIDPKLVGVIMTGQGTLQTAVDAMKTGAYDYILKPFKLNSLLPTLARAMEVRRLRQENLDLRDMLAVHEVAKVISTTLEAGSLLSTMADAAMRQFQADELSILFQVDGVLTVVASRPEARRHLLTQRPTEAAPAAWAAAHREPLLLQGPLDPGQFQPGYQRADIRSAMVVPMTVAGRCVGVLCVGATTRRPFTAGELKALTTLASTAAAALENASLYQRVQDALRALQEAQHRLVQQERLRALGEMASGVAHDFNNALTAILGFSETMLMFPEDLENKDKVFECLTTIDTIARDAAGLVQRLRSFYRPLDKDEVLSPIDLAGLVAQAATMTQPRWKGGAVHAINLQTELVRVPPVLGNEGELRQVFTNLIFNAVDAMPDGGRITLRVNPSEPAEVVVEIQDTGIGMTQETLARCLEPFYTTKGEQGTGLGLAMVYGAVQRHGGSIGFDTSPGRGTTVRLRFPTVTEVLLGG